MGSTPTATSMCKIFKVKPIAAHGYYNDCNPHPVIARKHHDENVSSGVCIGWQTEELLSDDRMATVVHRKSNYEEDKQND